MTCRFRHLLLAGVLFCALPAAGADFQTEADLLLDHEVAAPGQTILAGVRLKMPAGWHTYWQNPGDSGMATKITWRLPRGVTAGDIQWPVPEKHDFEGFITYVYHDVVVLRVPLTIGADAPLGPTEIRASLEWLECKETCVPGKGEVSAALTLAREPRKSANAAILEDWAKRLPVKSDDLKVTARWQDGESPDERKLVLSAVVPAGVTLADFFPHLDKSVEIGAATEVLSETATEINLRKTVMRFGEAAWPQTIAGILTTAAGAAVPAYEFTTTITDGPARALTDGAVASSGAPASGPAAAVSFWQMLLYAFVGGLILNIMPCVLPVIALKILGFVQQSKEAPGRVRMLGLVYGVGVLCSFLALAALVIGVRLGGNAAGWGMQFQSPQFLVVMTLLVTLVALNLFGVFEVTPGTGVMNAASQLSSREGASGAFFNGVLATVLATPCTAPFLAPALGFALNPSQPIWLVVLFFLTIGAGLAFPYVLLSFEPRWLKFLPKPGPWMERFKNAMGFPMLATAVWLFTLSAPRFGRGGELWLGLFLVLIALAVWIWGEFVQRGRKRTGAAMAVAGVVALTAYFFVLESKLTWRSPQVAAATTTGDELVINGVRWQRWSPDIVARLQAAGTPVVVNFTADWCLTCHTVVEPAIESAEVQAKVKELGAVLVYADYTNTPEELTKELQKFGRAGVPLVLVYPGKVNAEPEVIPDSVVTTIFRGSLLEALGKLRT